MNVCVYVWVFGSVCVCVWVCEQKDTLLLRLTQDRSTRGHLRIFLRRVCVSCSKSCYLNLIILLEIKSFISVYFSVLLSTFLSLYLRQLLNHLIYCVACRFAARHFVVWFYPSVYCVSCLPVEFSFLLKSIWISYEYDENALTHYDSDKQDETSQGEELHFMFKVWSKGFT